MEHFINIKIKGSNIIEQINAKYMPVPLLSLVTEDCIKNAKDYNQGGARYNTSYIQGVGMGTITDCFSSLKYNVYDKKNISMKTLMDAMEKNFEGNDILLHKLDQAPKYGNDNDSADDILRLIFQAYH